MIKQAPSLGRIAAMVVFALSCFGLLFYLWFAFGGASPLHPQGYRFEASFREAAMLVEQTDVRMAGLDVGKVVSKELDPETNMTVATIELDSKYAPIPRDTRIMLRAKSLLGETYVELTTGKGGGPDLADGGRLPREATREEVQIDEIIALFDPETREAYRSWVKELATAIDKGRGEDLNDALGHLPAFVADGKDVLGVLESEEGSLRRVIRNGGRTLAALDERRGQLRQLVVNANHVFDALASRNDALAETIFILPTFLDESRATIRRLREFSVDTRPLVRDLQPVARDLTPTLRDVGRFAPDLRALFRELDPLIDESARTLPAAARFLRGAEPLFEALHVYLPELNPIIAFAHHYQETVSDFIMNGGAGTAGVLPRREGEGPRHYLRQFSIIGSRSIGIARERPDYERGNAYPAPNYLKRLPAFGIQESFDCSPAGGEKVEPTDGQPPCFVQPPSLWDGKKYPRLGRGDAPIRRPPEGTEGRTPATPR